MKLNFYAVYDSISACAITSFSATNDAMAIRQNLPALSRVAPVRDLVLYHVGFFDDSSMELSSCPRRQVDWDSYKFPEVQSTATAAASSGLSSEAQSYIDNVIKDSIARSLSNSKNS